MVYREMYVIVWQVFNLYMYTFNMNQWCLYDSFFHSCECAECEAYTIKTNNNGT